jgi:hypothetical protein
VKREISVVSTEWKHGTATPLEIQQYKKHVQIQEETTDEKQAWLTKQQDH